MRARRQLTPFSLSFLDIMSCGFGSAALLFLIIKHNVDVNVPVPVNNRDAASEVTQLEEEIRIGKRNLARTRNDIAAVDEELVVAKGMARRVMEEIQETRSLSERLAQDVSAVELDRLKLNIKQLEEQKKRLEAEVAKTSDQSLRLVGEGNREYVTGLKLGGKRLLILLDGSASMLDDTIVNVIRFRNMRDERKRNAPKWTQTLRQAEWLLSRFPRNAKYQIRVFNVKTSSLLPGGSGQWLDVSDRKALQQVIEALRRVVPEGGTNLEQAFVSIGRMQPRPDNVYLLTDGLPTQGSRRTRGVTITGKQRLKLFERAVKKLPARVPINVILAPLEGDPAAAHAFWRLAVNTRGSFISPTEDWP